MVPGLNIHEHVKDALIYALDRTAEVLYGSFVAFILGYVFTLISPKYKVNIDELAEKWKEMTDDGHE
jgi:membrane protein YqaA with SNARE-associated domain